MHGGKQLNPTQLDFDFQSSLVFRCAFACFTQDMMSAAASQVFTSGLIRQVGSSKNTK